jgi:uncharacterized RDD family membrane protein YckC
MNSTDSQPSFSPKHAVAERTGLKAGFVSRAVASLIDILIILALAGITYLLIRGTTALMRIDISECRQFVPIVDVRSLLANFCSLSRILMVITVLSIAPLYLTALWLFAGRTIGMGIVGLRVVRTNGKRLRLATALIRLVGFTLSLLTLGVGFLWAIIDDDRQALHDKLARTYVIYWTGNVLYPHPPPPLPAKEGKQPAPFATLSSNRALPETASADAHAQAETINA